MYTLPEGALKGEWNAYKTVLMLNLEKALTDCVNAGLFLDESTIVNKENTFVIGHLNVDPSDVYPRK